METPLKLCILSPDKIKCLVIKLAIRWHNKEEIKMKFISKFKLGLLICSLVFFIPMIASAETIYVDPASHDFGDFFANTMEFKLSGVENTKGIDIGDVRYGTMFIGKVYEGVDEVGYWWTVIRYTGTENIEVCGGTNNLLRVKLVVVLNGGTLDGHRLVLGLEDPGVVDDIVWNAKAELCGPACHDEFCACPNNPGEIEDWVCNGSMPNGYGPVATIPGLELKAKRGSTLDINEAHLSGYLCHNWAFVPRILGYLTVVLDD